MTCEWCQDTDCLCEDFAPDDQDILYPPMDDMDGDHESALASAGFGTDEDYGCFDMGFDDF